VRSKTVKEHSLKTESLLKNKQSVLHTIASVQPDGVEEKGTRYVERLGGSSRTIRATGLVCKSRGAANAAMHMPIGGETNLLLTPSLHGVGGSLGENNYIAPQGAYRG
jgi:hypothetical protein